MSNVKLISHTIGAGELEGKSPQDVISFVARVSNPHNQENFHTSGGLLRYCIKPKANQGPMVKVTFVFHVIQIAPA